MGLNCDPGGGGPLDSCSATCCVLFLNLESEMTWVTSLAGTMYRGLRLLTLFTMVLKEVSYLDPSWMVLKEPFLCTFWGFMALVLLDLGSLLTHLVDGLERTLLPDFFFSIEVTWMVLKGVCWWLRFAPLLSPWGFAVYSQWMVLKGVSHAVFCCFLNS